MGHSEQDAVTVRCPQCGRVACGCTSPPGTIRMSTGSATSPSLREQYEGLIDSPYQGGSGGHTELRQRAGGGETNEWFTPPEIFQALDCDFDIDVAAPVGGVSWIPAARHYSYRDDGLGQPWEGRVWLNPPYGPHTAPWLGKLAQHGNGIALVFARTDVTWFQTIARQASLICFLRGRVRFIRAVGIARNSHNAAAPSCLMAFGDECAEIVRSSGLGLCAVLT